MSRYCTMALRVGITEALTTAACLRLLMLASGSEEEHKTVKQNVKKQKYGKWCWMRTLPPIWSSGQPILLSWLLIESISFTKCTRMVSFIHCHVRDKYNWLNVQSQDIVLQEKCSGNAFPNKMNKIGRNSHFLVWQSSCLCCQWPRGWLWCEPKPE